MKELKDFREPSCINIVGEIHLRRQMERYLALPPGYKT